MNAEALATPPLLDQDPYSEANLIDPYPWQREMRELAPVVRIEKYNAFAAALERGRAAHGLVQ